MSIVFINRYLSVINPKISCILQAHAQVYKEMSFADQFTDSIKRIGSDEVKGVVKSAVSKMSESLSQLNYLSEVALKHLFDALSKTDATSLDALNGIIEGILDKPLQRMFLAIHIRFIEAIKILHEKHKVDTQIGQALKAVIQDGTKCLLNTGVSTFGFIIMRTGKVQLALDKVKTSIFFFVNSFDKGILILVFSFNGAY